MTKYCIRIPVGTTFSNVSNNLSDIPDKKPGRRISISDTSSRNRKQPGPA